MTAPINVNRGGDIQQAVEYESPDLGDCIASGEINRWAKWKPLRLNKIGMLTTDERKENNWGLKLTKFTTISALVSGYSTEWTYLRPNGGTSQRFRISDFLNTSVSSSGYNKNARCFFEKEQSVFPTTYIKGTGGLSFIARWTPESQLDSSAPGSIKLSEIRINPSSEVSAALSSAYFGVIFYHANWNNIIIKTSATSFETDGYTSTVTFSDTDLQNFPSGVTVYPILSVNAISTIQYTFPSAGVFALPTSTSKASSSAPADADPITIDVMSADTLVQFNPNIEAYFQVKTLYLNGTIGIVTNSSGSSVSVSGVSINIYSASSMTDKTGTQIGTTYIFDDSVTVSSPLVVDPDDQFHYRVTRPDYIRIVITGYVSGETTIERDYNIGVSWVEDVLDVVL